MCFRRRPLQFLPPCRRILRENSREWLENLPDKRAAVLAVDGGDSKVDVALIAQDGTLLGARRGYGSAHFGLDHNGSLETVENAIRAACADGGIDSERKPVATTAVYCVAGADTPLVARGIAAKLGGRGWSRKTIVRNDTFAMLRAGTERGWGVAVVCGSGLKCAGVGHEGRGARA